MDEEQLRAVTIGELTPYATKVVISDYDEAWPDWFERDRARIAAALGPVALSIEHVGSTSVPGLPAKPIIDILLQVADTVHVFSPRYAEEEIDRMLVFRDRLRTHEADRNRYAATKRGLSTQDWRYVQDYADAKSEVVREILTRAQS